MVIHETTSDRVRELRVQFDLIRSEKDQTLVNLDEVRELLHLNARLPHNVDQQLLSNDLLDFFFVTTHP